MNGLFKDMTNRARSRPLFFAPVFALFLCACVNGLDENELADLLILENIAPPAQAATPGENGTTTVVDLQDNANGGITLFGQSLVWAKCSQMTVAGANMYNSAADDCSAGTAVTLRYCGTADDSCNGGTSPGVLDGGGSSQAWDSCANLNLAGRTDWRVPTGAELGFFVYHVFRNNSTYFDSIPANPEYWTSDSLTTTSALVIRADLTLTPARPKAIVLSLRCVTDL